MIDPSGKIIKTATIVHFQNGGFETVATVTNKSVLNQNIKWPSGMLPADSPDCGRTGDQCSADGNKKV